MTKKIIFAIALLLSASGYGNEYEIIIKEFFEKVKAGKEEDAVVKPMIRAYKILGYDVDEDQFKEQASGTISNLKSFRVNEGKLHSFGIFSVSSLGPNYKYVKSAFYYDTGPVEVSFTLYAPTGEWFLKNIYVNSHLEKELKEQVELKFN
ncbi:hypothetical protein [Planctobacterium marinum]|uniref:hypothetical protein n=1 Tax=Planctobacterium marinum TaxID=1631968 RepID=UPI001E51D1D5|nr:hypothetical protein [Planctobacterium marinum]MCC2608187.1 hypothetical protein [Planctobacterium marinum]